MKIGICATAADGGRSGISTYMRDVVRWLPSIAAEHTSELIACEDDLEWLAPAPQIGVVPLPRRLERPLRSIVWHQLELSLLAARRGYDVLFLLAANRRVPLIAPCPTVGVVHDLASFHVAGKYDRLRGVYVWRVLPRMIPRLTRVITLSEASRRDIVTHCDIEPGRVTVIPLGVDGARFAPGPADRAAARLAPLGIRPPFLLYVSRIEHPGKNHARLIDAFAALKRAGAPHQLVCAGADRERAGEVHARAAACGFAGDVRFPGFTDEDTLLALYHAADALVFPSLFEGFGLPVLEAMACGLPVVCSNVSSLPEVAGPAARYVDPEDTASLVEALRAVCGDRELRARMARASLARAAEFSPELTARRTLDVLELAAQGSSSSLNFVSTTL